MKPPSDSPRPPFKIPRIGLVVASVVLLSLAFPPANLNLLVFVALAPLLAYLRDSTAKQALKAGYLFGFLYFGFQMYWVFPFVTRWTGNQAMGAAPWILCAFLAGFFYMLTTWLIHLAYRQNRPWMIPFVWAGIEGLRAYFPVLAFPWAFVAHPLWPMPWLVQSAAFGTVLLISAWVVLINLIVSETLLRPADPSRHAPADHLMKYGIAAAAVFFAGAVRMSLPAPTEVKTITAGQPGVDMAFTTPEEEAAQLAAATQILVAESVTQQADLLVLPEGYAGSVYELPPDTPLGAAPPIPVIMGGNRFADATSYQSALLWDGQSWQYADKTRLVIMGEYVPFRDQLPFLRNFGVAYEDLSPGQTLITPEINGLRVGPLICFEGVFPDLAEKHSRQGGRVLIQMSIDDWYENTPAYEQLWQSTVWRSIESGLPIIRVGARGQTLATDHRGNLTHFIPVGQTNPLEVKVPLPKSSDAFPYRMAFLYISLALCLLLIVVKLTTSLRSRKRTEETG